MALPVWYFLCGTSCVTLPVWHFLDALLDKLLTQPVNPLAADLPSPQQLMNKIILKHKKLGENLAGASRFHLDVAESG